MIHVAVIGLGRVGCGVPGDTPRSHMGAIASVDGLTLAAAVDPSPEAREAARRLWSVDAPLLADVDALPVGASDVIVVATPIAARRQTVLAALKKRPKLLVVEKPFAFSLAEGERLAAAAAPYGVTIRVNFPRRFDPGHAAFRAAFVSEPLFILCRHGKGLFNYGSHMVDLLIDWFGPFERVTAFADDRPDDDPNLTFRAGMARGFEVLFVGIDGLGYDQFEAEFYLADRRLELAAGGVEKWCQAAVPDRYYTGYTQLGPREAVTPGARVGGFREFYRAVRDHLEYGAALAGCGPDDALHGIAVLEAARRSAESGGKTIPVIGPALRRA